MGGRRARIFASNGEAGGVVWGCIEEVLAVCVTAHKEHAGPPAECGCERKIPLLSHQVFPQW